MTGGSKVRLARHPLGEALHGELHARPPQELSPPLAVTHVVMTCDEEGRAGSRRHLARMFERLHRPPPREDQSHVRLDAGCFRLRWELHTEFVTWTFMRPAPASFDVAVSHALATVPSDWLQALPGLHLSGLHLLVGDSGLADMTALAQRHLHGHALIAARVAHGCADVYADFALHDDSFTRMVVASHSMLPRQLGRLVQQLLEIDTYRMVALLGVPVARGAVASIGRSEQDLAGLAREVRRCTREHESVLLDRLTRLAAQVEEQYAATQPRFSASAAYFDLVDRRLRSLRERPLATHQTIGEFIERRLGPARSTCESVARRQAALARRMSRMSDLLRTRVEVAQQEGSRALLAAMNRRQGIQLQVQTTVEGLSVAAITYYVAGLAHYAAEAAHALGWPWSADATAAAAIPMAACGVWWSLRKLHRRVRKGGLTACAVPVFRSSNPDA